jgi:hypothetical protein
VPLPVLDQLFIRAASTNAYIACPIPATTANNTIVIVTATLIPDVKWLVQITERSTAITMMIPIHHIAAPFPSARRMLAIRSWLKATRMKGIEMAAEMVTFERLVKPLELYYFLIGINVWVTYAYISAHSS